MRPNVRKSKALLLAFAVVAGLGSRQAMAAFPPPIQATPATQYTAAFGVDYNNVQTFTRILNKDLNNFPPTPYPDLYWFKYTSDGQSIVKFDTLGSSFSTSAGGTVLGSYNESQIAVYKANGDFVAISKGTRDLNGDPIPQYPNYSSNPDDYYKSQGLTEMYFQPNAPDNPHWFVDPNDPNPFIAPGAPWNGNGQVYSINEYQVWNTALNTPSWRNGDRARHGPGTPWNRFDLLPAGDYYIAVSSASPTFAGDVSKEEILMAPVHYDYDLNQNVAILTQPMGTFQYYFNAGTNPYVGTIVLNATHYALPTETEWTHPTSSTWSDPANWSSGSPNAAGKIANLLGAIGANSTVTLNSNATVGNLVFNNANSYTIAGSGTLTLAQSIADRAVIQVVSGSHAINVPLNFQSDVDLKVDGTLSLGLPISAGNKSVVKTGSGIATTSRITAQGINVQAGTLQITAQPAANSAAGTSVVYLLNASGSGKLDLTNNSLIVDYANGNSQLGTFTAYVRSNLAAGRIMSSLADAATRIGYVDNFSSGLNKTTFGGVSVDPKSFLLMFTLGGDTDLDADVDSVDFNRFVPAYGKLANAIWLEGDFDYDGKVTTKDFNYFAGNFGSSLPAPALGAVVPEPVGTAALLMGIGLIDRRRMR